MRVPSSSRSARVQLARGAALPLAAFGVLGTCAIPALAGPATPPSVRPTATAATLQDLIAEASRRFGVPASWIAEVMAVESRGHGNALSPKGAIGLMQVMPATYAGLASRYGLGPDPWNPHDNVLAGAAYLRELYDRYGTSGFLVAYNAGPGRWDDYRLRARPLPAETVAYLARLGPVVGASVAPLPTFTAAVAPRSPFAAPIFVALSTDPARVQEAPERARIVRIIDANTTVVGRANAIFVIRPRAADPPATDGSERDGAAEQSPSGGARVSKSPAADQPSNPLFPDRSSGGLSR